MTRRQGDELAYIRFRVTIKTHVLVYNMEVVDGRPHPE
jgi:hypothetical protein